LAGAGRLLYQGATPDESGTTRVRLIVAVGGHEVDVSVVNLQWIAGLAARARRANVSIEPFEACVLSRLKTGWVLTADDSTLNWLCEWKADLSLEIHMTVSYFVFANQLLDDADAAIDEDPQLATILARRAVDRLFEAFLSSRGYAYAGPKWLRLLRKLLSDGSAEWSSAGLDLLSKGASGREQSAQLLSDARCFMRTIRQKLDAEPAYKTALAICPQLEWRR
jgi:hypothetical protein